MIEGKWIWRVLEGTIKGDISLKPGLSGVTEKASEQCHWLCFLHDMP